MGPGVLEERSLEVDAQGPRAGAGVVVHPLGHRRQLLLQHIQRCGDQRWQEGRGAAGAHRHGDGVQGLVRGFIHAAAPRTVYLQIHQAREQDALDLLDVLGPCWCWVPVAHPLDHAVFDLDKRTGGDRVRKNDRIGL
ncbi:MAG: hypothetical protein ACYS5W_13735 [Planctomycetota bacterium]